MEQLAAFSTSFLPRDSSKEELCLRYRLSQCDVNSNGKIPATPQPNESEAPAAVTKRTLPRTKSRADVACVYHQAHVLEGYRETGQPWSYYLRSLFSVHNETLNCWTHLLALGFSFYQFYWLQCQEQMFSDNLLAPLTCACLVGMYLYAVSSGAHLLHSRSVHVNCVGFMADYSGIGLYGLTAGICHLAYCAEDDLYAEVQSYFVPVCVILSCFSCAAGAYNKMHSVVADTPSNAGRYKVVPVGLLYVWANVPLVHRFYSCAAHDLHCDESLPLHAVQIASFLIGAVFYSVHIPQRFFCLSEIWFNSHALFHICVSITITFQVWASYSDLLLERQLIASRANLTFANTFGVVAATFVIHGVIIFTLHLLLKRRLKKLN